MLASAIRYVSQLNFFFLASFEEGYILTEYFFANNLCITWYLVVYMNNHNIKIARDFES